MIPEILDRAAALLGETEVNESALSAACEAAIGELSLRLKTGVSPEGLSERFVTAAAMLALSVYTQLSGSTAVSSFKAGDVSVSRRSAAETLAAAQTLRQQALTLLADALIDTGFEFRGVDG